MNELKIFNYTDKQVRTIIKDNEPWFVANDVCSILEISNGRDAVSRLDVDEKDAVGITDTIGREQQTTVITESGVYELVFTSRKPEAASFKRWIRKEVLPSIRKHGMYAADELLDNPDLLIEVATKLKEERTLRLAAEQKIERQKPQVLFAESVTASDTSILVADLAKILNKNGIDIGEIRLWKWLRKNKYVISEKGRSYNMPTQKSMDLKIMEVKEGTYINSKGESKITKTTLITGKGQVYFVNKFLKAREESLCLSK